MRYQLFPRVKTLFVRRLGISLFPAPASQLAQLNHRPYHVCLAVYDLCKSPSVRYAKRKSKIKNDEIMENIDKIMATSDPNKQLILMNEFTRRVRDTASLTSVINLFHCFCKKRYKMTTEK